jgi:hypothetical protein
MPEWDMSEVYKILPIAVLMAWTFVIPQFLPETWRQPVGMIGMVVSILFMLVVEEILRLMAAEYPHILAICRPSNIQLDLFIEKKQSREIKPGLFSTKLTLGQRVKHPYWQILEYVVIKHWKAWEKRIEYTKRKVKFKGEMVTHPNSAVVTLYEEAASDVDHLNPVPTFTLTEAPKDVHDPQDRWREIVAPMLAMNGGELSAEQMFDMERLQAANAELETKNTEYKRQAMYWHNLAIKGEGANKSLKNELHGVLGSDPDQNQAVVEQVLRALGAHVDIHEALKSLRGPFSWLNKTIVGIIALVVLGAVFLFNPDPIMSWLVRKEVQALIFIGLVIGGAMYFYAKRR